MRERLQQVEITEAAIGTCGRLQAANRGRLTTYRSGDGGLICEDRVSPARPRMWRILPTGELQPDRRYSFTLHAFTSGALPHGI
jgi:hypothetical protein